jgi:hypothetical protein
MEVKPGWFQLFDSCGSRFCSAGRNGHLSGPVRPCIQGTLVSVKIQAALWNTLIKNLIAQYAISGTTFEANYTFMHGILPVSY